MRNKKILTLLCILTPILAMILSTYFNLERIPNEIFVRENDSIKTGYFVRLCDKQNAAMVDSSNGRSMNRSVDLKLLGFLPVKSVSIRAVPEMSLYPGGFSIGVKLNTKGVLVVALSDIESEEGKIQSPAAQSGIAIGDSILRINNKTIENSEMLVSEINSNQDQEIIFEIERKGEISTKKIKPVRSSSESKYKIGLWVRDSTAGVGTLTFYDDRTKKFAALGHPVTDVDTGTILNINEGELVSSSIVSIRKGIKGNPGELKGIFVDEDIVLGKV
ncbi:MAG: spoIVB, partial [Bacillota bacterium]|nr:spoIVB [Bacillota bacterium]